MRRHPIPIQHHMQHCLKGECRLNSLPGNADESTMPVDEGDESVARRRVSQQCLGGRAEHSRAEAAAAANANARWRPVSPARAARSTAGGPSMRSQALDVCIEDTWQLHSWMSSISGSLTLTGHQ